MEKIVPPLAGRIAALEQGHHPLAALVQPELQLDQFDLQPPQRLGVVVLVHLVVIGVAAGGQRLFVYPVRQLRIVDVEDAAAPVNLDVDRTVLA